MKSFEITLNQADIAPGRLCVITRRDGTVIRISDQVDSEANETDAIVVDGDTYTVVPGLQISAVRHTLGGDAPSVEIIGMHTVGGTFDTGDIACGLFDGATVQIYIIDITNVAAVATLGLLFTGTVQPQRYDIDGTFRFDVRGTGTKARGVFVPKFSPMCRTDLFSSLCQLNAGDFDQSGTVGAIVNKHNITIAGLASPPVDGYFNQGVAVLASGIAFDIANWTQSSLLLTSYLDINNLVTVSEAITLYPGCDKTMGAGGCGKFANFINFQGEPHYLGAAAASAAGG